MAHRTDRIRGMAMVNYLPTWERESAFQWLDVPQATLRRELTFAARLGFSGVRVWLNAWGWRADPERYTGNVKILMDAASSLGLGVVPILFDSCGQDEELGDSVERSLEEALSGWTGHPAMDFLRRLDADPRTDLLGASALVMVADRGEPAAAIWEHGWRPSPGYRHLAGTQVWERYVRDITGVISGHPALVVCDLMNEPHVTQIGHAVDLDPVDEFVEWVHGLVRSIAPEMPLTVGDNSLAAFAVHDKAVGGDLDVVSFHEYVHDRVPFHQSEDLRVKASEVLDYAGERPVFLSECGTFPGMHDSDQLAVYREELPVWRSLGLAWAPFHLIAGYGIQALSALLYPNGTMRPAAAYLRSVLNG